MTTAVIVPVADKFVSVINGKVFNTSKHVDYLEHHQKLSDLKTLNALGVTLFVHTDIAGAVVECIEAEALSKGKSYKTAERYTAALEEPELKIIAEAFALVTKPVATPAVKTLDSPLSAEEQKQYEEAKARNEAAAVTVATAPTAAPAPSATVGTVTPPANDSQVLMQAMTAATPKKARKAK